MMVDWIKRAFKSFIGLIIDIFKSIIGADIEARVKNSLYLALTLTFLTTFLILILTIKGIFDKVASESVDQSSLVNTDDFDYHVVKSADYMFSNKKSKSVMDAFKNFWDSLKNACFYNPYPFIWVFIFAFVNVILLLILIVSEKFRTQLLSGTDGMFKLGFLYIALQTILIMLIGLPFFVIAHKDLNKVETQIDKYNSYIYNRILADPAFLTALSTTVATSPSNLIDIEKNVLKTLNDSSSVDKGLFTMNIWKNMYNMGYSSKHINNAIALFSAKGLISEASFKPSDYLLQDGSFIEDETYRRIQDIEGLLKLDTPIGSLKFNKEETVNNVALWTITANDLANSIDSNMTKGPFSKMSMYMFIIVMIVPFIAFMIKKLLLPTEVEPVKNVPNEKLNQI